MIVVVEQYNAHEYSRFMDQMFQMRARVFHDRLKWNVQVFDGKERDKYDDEAPVYILYVDDQSQKVKGSLRLMPTTGPTLLADIFSDTLPAGVHLSAPTIWECTRLCLDDRILASESRHQVLFDFTAFIIGLGEVAVQAGIETILGNFEPSMLRLYKQIGCEIELLGSTQRFGETVHLGAFRVSALVLEKLRTKLDALQASTAKWKVAA